MTCLPAGEHCLSREDGEAEGALLKECSACYRLKGDLRQFLPVMEAGHGRGTHDIYFISNLAPETSTHFLMKIDLFEYSVP